MPRSIVVLEDAVERISWLKRVVPGVNVVWCKTVASFLSTLKGLTPEEVGLIILDHDLGADEQDGETVISQSSSWPRDADGSTGMDVVYQLESWKDVPVVVWSINTPRAQEMTVRLTEQGFAAVRIPFGMDRVRMIAILAGAGQDE